MTQNKAIRGYCKECDAITCHCVDKRDEKNIFIVIGQHGIWSKDGTHKCFQAYSTFKKLGFAERWIKINSSTKGEYSIFTCPIWLLQKDINYVKGIRKNYWRN